MSVPQSPHQSGSSNQNEPDTPRQSTETVYHLASEWLDNDEDGSDDHDMDYEPPSERSGDTDCVGGGSGGVGDESNGEQDVGGMIGTGVS